MFSHTQHETRAPRARIVAAFLLCASAAACTGVQVEPGPAPGATSSAQVTASHTGPAPTASAPVSAHEFEAIYRARTDSLRSRYSAADVHFMNGMIGHHAQAIVMAKMAATHGASASVQTLAGRIINAQEDEIATMQRWLADRGQPVPEVHIMGIEVMMHGGMGHDHAQMPGMLSMEQMKALDAARGAEFDRLFLTGMIQHHQGAVVMVRELFATDGAGQDEQVFKFASDVQVDQNTEIARMELMLSALPAARGAR